MAVNTRVQERVNMKTTFLSDFEIEKTETEIQKEIREYSESFGWDVYRMQSGRKGGVRLHKKSTPDLMAQRKGKTIWIEVKKPGEEPDEDQLERHEEIRANGFVVLVVCSVEKLRRCSTNGKRGNRQKTVQP